MSPPWTHRAQRYRRDGGRGCAVLGHGRAAQAAGRALPADAGHYAARPGVVAVRAAAVPAPRALASALDRALALASRCAPRSASSCSSASSSRSSGCRSPTPTRSSCARRCSSRRFRCRCSASSVAAGQWIAIGVGLAGVLVMLRPTGAGWATLGGLAAALVRRLLCRERDRAASAVAHRDQREPGLLVHADAQRSAPVCSRCRSGDRCCSRTCR